MKPVIFALLLFILSVMSLPLSGQSTSSSDLSVLKKVANAVTIKTLNESHQSSVEEDAPSGFMVPELTRQETADEKLARINTVVRQKERVEREKEREERERRRRNAYYGNNNGGRPNHQQAVGSAVASNASAIPSGASANGISAANTLIGTWTRNDAESSTWKFSRNGQGELVRDSVNGIPGRLTIYFNWTADMGASQLTYTNYRISLTGSPYAKDQQLSDPASTEPFTLSGNTLTIGGKDYYRSGRSTGGSSDSTFTRKQPTLEYDKNDAASQNSYERERLPVLGGGASAGGSNNASHGRHGNRTGETYQIVDGIVLVTNRSGGIAMCNCGGYKTANHASTTCPVGYSMHLGAWDISSAELAKDGGASWAKDKVDRDLEEKYRKVPVRVDWGDQRYSELNVGLPTVDASQYNTSSRPPPSEPGKFLTAPLDTRSHHGILRERK